MESMGWQCRAENIDLSVGHFINGEIVSCSGDNSITKKSPRDGSLLYQFAGGGGKEVNEAVSVSRQALDDGRWSSLSIQQRKIVIYKLAELVESHKEKFAFYESLDVGKPVDQSFSDISWATNILRECAEGADKLISSSSMDGLNYQVRKPIGVVAAIIGWNFPLVLAAQKVGPALVMGNSLVLKPSEYSALSATLLASLALEAGVPPGVFNVVQGAGATVGAALAHHNSVNLLTFTGSSATGKKMMIAAGQSNMKRLMLECGGKSPYIVFEDCPEDLDFIAQDIVETAFRNQGQVCVAGTRLLIHNRLKAALLEKVKHYTAQLKPGDPLNPETNFGPLINKAQLDKVLAYIDSGITEGAELIYGGKPISLDNDSHSQGYYLEPAIFDGVKPQHKIAREEIFGPVLSVMGFDNEAEAIQLANDSSYGLAAYVATQDLSRSKRLSKNLNAGMILILASNTPIDSFVPIGLEGRLESGFGHEGGLSGLIQYTASASVHFFV